MTKTLEDIACAVIAWRHTLGRYQLPTVEECEAALAASPFKTFKPGDFVCKKSGSSWRGWIVGTYSTILTPEGYCIESAFEPNSVQNYPVAALEASTQPRTVLVDHPALAQARESLAEVTGRLIVYISLEELNHNADNAIDRAKAALAALYKLMED